MAYLAYGITSFIITIGDADRSRGGKKRKKRRGEDHPDPIPDTRYPIPGSRYPMADSRYPIPGSRYPVADTRYPRIPETLLLVVVIIVITHVQHRIPVS